MIVIGFYRALRSGIFVRGIRKGADRSVVGWLLWDEVERVRWVVRGGDG